MNENKNTQVGRIKFGRTTNAVPNSPVYVDFVNSVKYKDALRKIRQLANAMLEMTFHDDKDKIVGLIDEVLDDD
jgi:Zn-dependent oligopeptidase